MYTCTTCVRMLSRGMCVGGEEEEKKAFLTFVNNVDQPAM